MTVSGLTVGFEARERQQAEELKAAIEQQMKDKQMQKEHEEYSQKMYD